MGSSRSQAVALLTGAIVSQALSDVAGKDAQVRRGESCHDITTRKYPIPQRDPRSVQSSSLASVKGKAALSCELQVTPIGFHGIWVEQDPHLPRITNHFTKVGGASVGKRTHLKGTQAMQRGSRTPGVLTCSEPTTNHCATRK
ncbi:hypothetical protein UY3_01237 [Chelonia mydas]|uniref:Uncharacterized protein n=1 Tax=Chelonia mydas TaxID=8469 RepID=M7BWE2_CHEMY|nr:hypothetical protein UY3_01237 [Chelonia mydas]